MEEAFCFGWIDGIGKKIDDDEFAQRFTPRRDCTNWSALNRRRLRRLIHEGRMTDAGLAKVDPAILGARDGGVPRFVKQALMARPKAWAYFQTLAPSYRRHYIGWIMHAKKQETRERRLREAVSLLARNQKLGLK